MIRNLKQYIYLIQHNGSSSSSVHHNNTSRLHEWLSERNKTRSRNAAHSITCKLIFRKAETNGRSSALNKKRRIYSLSALRYQPANVCLCLHGRLNARRPPTDSGRAGSLTALSAQPTMYSWFYPAYIDRVSHPAHTFKRTRTLRLYPVQINSRV